MADLKTNSNELQEVLNILANKVDSSTLQPKHDENLNTESKEVVGAINELDDRMDALIGDYPKGLYYGLNSDNASYYISGTNCTDSDIVVPRMHKGMPVTMIGFYAFMNYKPVLTSISIPNSIVCIGNEAFRTCDSLTSIVIPDSVTSIGNNAFTGCSSLTIYCEADSKPEGWDDNWNPDNRPVVWGFANDFIAVNEKINTKVPQVSITYSELAALRNNGGLVPGQAYRITDYQCTTNLENTQALTNQFDIIVRALDNKTLSEVASITHHEGDTYFAGINLAAWEIKYCLDNDFLRFNWAAPEQEITNVQSKYSNGEPLVRMPHMDGMSGTIYYYAWGTQADMTNNEGKSSNFVYSMTKSLSERQTVLRAYDGSTFDIQIKTNTNAGGKGVIYYMKDHRNNEFGYDFTNITYKGSAINGYETFGLDPETYYATFTYTNLQEYNQWGSTYTVSRNSSLDQTIGGTNYYGYTCSSAPSAWGTANFYIVDEDINSSSTMYLITNGTVSTISYGGTLYIRDSLAVSLLEKSTADNVLHKAGEAHGKIKIELPFIVFLENNCYGNILGTNCHKNTFGRNCSNNMLSDSCYLNIFGDGCCENILSNLCYRNTFGMNCKYNTFNSYCCIITLGRENWYNTFDSGCQYITFGSGPDQLITAAKNIHFASGSAYIKLLNSESANSSLQNITVSAGITGTSSKHLELQVERGAAPTVFKVNTNVKIFNSSTNTWETETTAAINYDEETQTLSITTEGE
jgi:hypothetical protein